MQRYPSALRLRSNRFSPIIVTVATCLCFAAAGFAASGLKPPLEGVSPGDRERVSPIRDGCPTFSWAAVPGAQAHELAVYRFTGNAANAAEDPVLTQRVPATFSWTPDLDACLEAGRYAWVVRARTESGWTDWSEPRHFEVKTGSSSAELRKVVEDVLAEWLTEKRIPLAEANALRSVPLSNYSPSGGKSPQPLAEAAFTPAPCQAGQEVFADVAASSPYCAAIQQLYADQLTAGCATGPLRFCPDLPVLRKHVALFLEKAFHAKDALQIDAGGEFACGIKSDGRVVCWGFNGDGQVSPVPPGTYTQISAGSSHACGVLTNSTVVCWGLNTSAQVSPVTAGTYTRVSAGGSHTCGLQTNATVACWGNNSVGQVSPVPPGTYTHVATGSFHSCGVQTGGAVVCWGFNGDGQVSPVPPGTYTQVSAGNVHSCGLQTNGAIACWGYNGSGQVSPVPPGTYAQVSAGFSHTCGLQTNGTVACWGNNGSGQVSPVPPGTYAQVTAGHSHNCGVQTNGAVACWGLNFSGQVSPVPAGNYAQVSAGGAFSCGLQTSGAVSFWGSTSSGEANPPLWFP